MPWTVNRIVKLNIHHQLVAWLVRQQKMTWMTDTSTAEVNQRSQASHAASATAVNPSPAELEEVVVPSVTALQGAPHIKQKSTEDSSILLN